MSGENHGIFIWNSLQLQSKYTTRMSKESGAAGDISSCGKVGSFSGEKQAKNLSSVWC